MDPEESQMTSLNLYPKEGLHSVGVKRNQRTDDSFSKGIHQESGFLEEHADF